MRGKALFAAIALTLGAAPALPAPALASPVISAPAPDLAACRSPAAPDSGERQRKRPLPVPAALRGVLKSDLLHFAVSTLGGGTLCIDTSEVETAEHVALSADGRFLSYGWQGYEAYGHILADRTGRGQAIEVGASPVFAPSGGLFAAVDQSESEFGSLSGLAVWRSNAVGVREAGRFPDLPRMSGWRIDRWAGESCIALSALPLEAGPDSKLPRTRFAAKPAHGGWTVARGTCPSA